MLRYLRATSRWWSGIVLLGMLVVFMVRRRVHGRYRATPAAVGAGAAAAVVGLSVRHRPPGTRPAGGDGGRHAADLADRLHRRVSSASASALCWPSPPPITGGVVDTVIRSIADIGLTMPGLLVLIIIAVSLKGSLTVNQMAIIVASLAWLNPTRTIRSQVLTLRERGYVEIARLNGMSGPEIILRELMPNLLPYLAGNAGQQRLRRDPRFGRAGGAGARAGGGADAGHDALLGQLQRRDHQRLVVVVDCAAGRHRHRVPRPVLPDRRSGRDRQSRRLRQSA